MEERRQRAHRGTNPNDVGAILKRIESTVSSVAETTSELMRRVSALEGQGVQIQEVSAMSATEEQKKIDAARLVGRQIPPVAVRSEYEVERRRFRDYMANPNTPSRVLRVRKGEEYEALISGHRIIFTAGKYTVPELLYEVYEQWRERMEEAHDLARKFMTTDENGNMDMDRLSRAVKAMEAPSKSQALPNLAAMMQELAGEPDTWER